MLSWRGAPFGAVVRSEHDHGRVVTDLALYREAYQGLAALRMPDLTGDVVVAGHETDALDVAGGQSLVVGSDGLRAVPRRLTVGGRTVVDPVALAGLLVAAHGVGADLTASLDRVDGDELAAMLLASASTDLRRATEFDLTPVMSATDAVTRGWPGLLVSDGEDTYVVAIDAYDLRKPVANALKVMRLGPADAFDGLATGAVLERGDAPGAAAPRP